MKKNWQSCQEMVYTFKGTNILITGIPEGKEKGTQQMLDEIIVEHIPH